MSKNKEEIVNDNVLQAILVANTFGDEFLPLSNDIPLGLFPLLNKPILDYTLEFLSLGGVEETFLFCCSHIDLIKEYIRKSIEQTAGWSLRMKVHIIVSECCRSFGDCLRDIDAKGLLRGNFVLLEPGAVSNIKLLPILKKHSDITKLDRGADMTLIFQEAGRGQIGLSVPDEVILAMNSNNRILYHKKIGQTKERKLEFPLDIFLENNEVSILHNLKDTHIAICSSSVLPLFADNFDFQTRDDFIKVILMNDEVLGRTIYGHIVKGSQYGGAITNWRNYQSISYELNHKWAYPLRPSVKINRQLKNDVIIGQNTIIDDSSKIVRTVIGDGVVIGKNVQIEDAFIMSDCKIEENVAINSSVIGPHCILKAKSKVLHDSILGKNVIIDENVTVEGKLIQADIFGNSETSDRLGEHAYIVTEDDYENDAVLLNRLPQLHITAGYKEETVSEEDFSDTDDEDDLSHTQSPPPDDINVFFTEVIDSLTRGFEDELQCENLILEINSSRYAYNISLKEVNHNVIKAILHMSLSYSIGPQYFSHLLRLLSYFSPILKNYIRKENAMIDCLKAIEDVATTNENLNEKWVMFLLKWFYDKDHLSEDAILQWSAALDKSNKFYSQVQPFIAWLEEAEEASSSEED